MRWVPFQRRNRSRYRWNRCRSSGPADSAQRPERDHQLVERVAAPSAQAFLVAGSPEPSRSCPSAPCTSAARSAGRWTASSTGPPRRQVEEHEREDHGHEEHDLRLAWVAHDRRHLLLNEHRHAHENGQHVRRVVPREIADPKSMPKMRPEADERGVLQVHRYREHIVERVEDRNLDEHRKAAAQRVHLVRAVELHGLALQALRVALVLRAKRIDLRLERLHGLHRGHALHGEREQDHLRDHSQQDDRDAIVRDEAVRGFPPRSRALGTTMSLHRERGKAVMNRP